MASGFHQGEFAGTNWDIGLYHEFSNLRLRPGLELLGRVQGTFPSVIYDLGCGAGQLARIIAERWPSASVFGVDNSKQMLEAAASEGGQVEWVEGDLGDWQPEKSPDLLYSNAALHWVTSHHLLFPRLVGLLNDGGCLAVQMPLSWAAPSHRLMRETLANGGANGAPLGTEKLRQAVGSNWVKSATEYHELLAGRVRSLDVWETEYLQVFAGEDPVIAWVKGTGLRPILNTLNDNDRAVFLLEYSRRLRVEYPMNSDGKTLYPFRRLFIVATV